MNGVFKNFLEMPAPAGYVPGLGRGATGFTTRSDIGPAKSNAADKAFQVPEEEDGADRFQDAEEDDDGDKDTENDDGLLGKGNFDLEDQEADDIYKRIDERMAQRRKVQREEREKQEQEEFDRKNPSISDQFTDLKRALGVVSSDEWANLPEAGDLTRRNKRQRISQQADRRFYAVPDSVLQGARSATAMNDSVDDADEQGDGTVTDFRSIATARDKMLGLKLDQLNSGTSGTSSVIDPKGYLTSLADRSVGTVDIGDIKRVRPLLESLVKSDPKEARGWIGLSRLEEIASRKSKARTIIAQGCDNCPRNEDVWLENMRLNDKHDARIIAARAVRFNPNSVRIWQAACDLEDDDESKKKVIQKALENNSASDTLWRAAVNLENDPQEAKLLLAQAVELVPLSEDLWLALARLETPNNARKVLNKARKLLKTSRAIWIAAARLEEQDKKDPRRVDDIFAKGIRELEKEGGLPSRTQWISDAETCENDGATMTCHAIIKATLGQGLEEESEDDRKSIWLEDARAIIARKCFDTARAVYAFVLRQFPTSRSVWIAAVELEREYGTKESLYEVLDKSTSACPTVEELWLLFSHEKAKAGDMAGARQVLAKAFESNANSEKIWLAAFKLETDDKKYDRALKLLARARADAGTCQMWVKAIILEYQLNHLQESLDLIQEGLELFPQEPELHIQKGLIYEHMNKLNDASSAYGFGTKACPKSVKLWILHARLEEKNGVAIRARTILDRASLAISKNELIWLERVQLERRQNELRQAGILVTKALQECPTSGLLWSEFIGLQTRLQRKSKIVDAVKACENDPYVLVTVAKDMWANGRAKARVWFERAVKADPKIGDAWLWLYRYIHETSEDRDKELEQVVEQFLASDPDQGLAWTAVKEDISSFEKSTKEVFISTALQLTIEPGAN